MFTSSPNVSMQIVPARSTAEIGDHVEKVAHMVAVVEDKFRRAD